MQRSHSRITGIGEHELPRGADTNHLVVDDVGSHPDQLEIPPSLAKHLLPCRERDQVCESLECHRITVVNQLSDRGRQAGQLSHELAPVEVQAGGRAGTWWPAHTASRAAT